jgi:uncharacterized protein
MPRPIKERNICCMPHHRQFGPENQSAESSNGLVILTLDEYETIRLIDMENFTQEECSVQMNIARTTVQGIYDDARKKIADVIVNGKQMRIEGGVVRVCEDNQGMCPRGNRLRPCCQRQKSLSKTNQG